MCVCARARARVCLFVCFSSLFSSRHLLLLLVVFPSVSWLFNLSFLPFCFCLCVCVCVCVCVNVIPPPPSDLIV